MPKKILLADDSITIQKVVELTFSDGDYEVTAVNNGARAVQKLTEMRPDIILSDIIMPEKNGYEVCEFVKSHPEYRHIPVILLTGTFEPFDPDRADKAGCDAVVTKPFESQSLILKVEELIEQSRASASSRQPAAAAAPPPPAPAPSAPAPSPWEDEAPAAPAPFSSAEAFNAPPSFSAPSSFNAPPSFNPPPPPPTHGNEIFGGTGSSGSSQNNMPFAPPPPPPPSGSDTRAVPKVSGEDNQASTQQASAGGGETRAFPKFDFGSLSGMEKTPPPPPAEDDTTDDSPFGASPGAEQFSGETRAFPKMSYDDLKNMASQPATPPPSPAPSMPAWDAPPPPPPQPPQGETRGFPPMSFDDFDRSSQSAPAEESKSSSMWDEKPANEEPAWASSSPTPDADESPSPFGAHEEEESDRSAEADQPSWALTAPDPELSESAMGGAAAVSSSSGNGSDLTDDQVDRIARRVVQLMSDQVVRNIAWEVIPDLAEMVVKERIRQLESEN